MERSFNTTLPSPASVAAEALGYFQKSYSLDHGQAGSAEGVGDLLASGGVGAGRRLEALDWYYKAATSYVGMGLPPDLLRQQTTRILEKMAGIDRENPLTKKLEQAIYKWRRERRPVRRGSPRMRTRGRSARLCECWRGY